MNLFKTPARLLLSLIFLLPTLPAWAQNHSSPDRNMTGFESVEEAQPLWEFGVGGGVIQVPNYPASSERNLIALALPYLIYRGDVFRIGDGGARAVVLENQNFEIDISVGGAFSADSDDNTAREGMPELDFLFEIGPQLVYRITDFSSAQGGSGRLNFHLQTRAVFSTDLQGIDHRGFVIEPELTYQQRGLFTEDMAFNASFSLVFATEKLHDYFYQVDPPFATDSRAEFNASGGFLGAQLSAGVSFSLHDNVRGFAGGTLRLHHGAANSDSPLFEEDLTYSLGIGFVWRLYESDTKASW